MTMTRRGLLAAAAGSTAAALAACTSDTPTVSVSRPTPGLRVILPGPYDAVVRGGPVAQPSVVAASTWASRIKRAGVLRRGGTTTGAIFSLQDANTGRILGFDAGIGDLLAHYILGGTDVTSLTQVVETDAATRESVLQSNAADVVVSSYSITTSRAQKVAFAGPYYSSGVSIQVRTDNERIRSVVDLKGKALVTETGSAGVRAIQKYVPGNQPTLYDDNESCTLAVEQGRADAYVIDEMILLSNAVRNPNLTVVGNPFTSDPWGIGVTRNDPAVKVFVNTFLQRIYDSGDWLKLWKVTVGAYVQATPSPPALGSAAGS